MHWNPYYGTYLGADVVVRDQRRSQGGDRPSRRPDPRKTPSPFPQRPDPRVTTPRFPQPQQPDPRVTTRPEDVRPRDGRDHDRDRDRDRRPRYHRPYRQDYVLIPGYDYWPSWYPYWDPYWYWYWEYLFWYYRGYQDPEYAIAARDAVLRAMAPQRGWL